MPNDANFDFSKASKDISHIWRAVGIARCIAMLIFGWMFLTGALHTIIPQTTLTDDFGAIAKYVGGLIGMVLVDISISLAAIKQRR